MGIELQGTPVCVPRLAGLDGLELEPELVPVCGVQVAFGRARRLRRTSGDRCRPGPETRTREIEMRLPRLGIPRGVPVTHHNAVALGRDAQLGERAAAGQLVPQLLERMTDPPRRNPGGHECLRGPQNDQILERELELASTSATRPGWGRQKTVAREASHLRDGQSQQFGYVPGSVSLQDRKSVV